MRNKIGFAIDNEVPTAASVPMLESIPASVIPPNKCIVRVRFRDDESLSEYYNDKYFLEEGDAVLVSGKHNDLGIVEEVITCFKVRASGFETVIAKPCIEMHGSYEAVLNKMVSFDAEAPDASTFRSWILPPVKSDSDEFLVGEGYSFEFIDLERSEDADKEMIHKALKTCQSSRLVYLGVKNGVGTAFLLGNSPYEMNFKFNDGIVSELYCTCSSAGLCYHELAMMITLRSLMMCKNEIESGNDFVAIDKEFFWLHLSRTSNSITL